MDADSQTYFDDLREAHFPPERNFLRAHVTLFHALPGELLPEVEEAMARLTAGTPSVLDGRVWRVRSLGRGVAFDVECPALATLRGALQQAGWELTKQDAQRSWRPHITVQNKVAPEVARALLSELSARFVERRIEFVGLTLWEYLGGPWRLVREFPFGGVEVRL
jgi:2'-5' RNA ligase